MAEPIIALEGVTKTYGEVVRTEVLRGIDLRIEAGEFAALVGPSGSGKSTLLNILGLLDRPSHGRVVVQNRDTSDLDDDALTRVRGRTIGFVFQFHHLLAAFSAQENVLLPLAADGGRTTPEMYARALELLRLVGLADKAHNKPSELSGGQQQRVALARALALQPALVLADEPTGNLDRASAARVFELLRRSTEQLGTAFLMVTHDPSLATQCDRTIELVDGRIVADHATA